ncbi:MAG: hypothetical protein IJZ79_02710 [Bacilli bacterium]|nr:hypothetical protein [Bacilli bacterium]MBQ8218636.1 hypothetical protein [Bacilli bacterium]
MSKEPNGDRWSKGFNKAVNSITHGPKKKIDSARQSLHDEMIPLKHDIDEVARKAKVGIGNVKDFANTKGIGNKAKFVAKKLGNNAVNSEAFKKIQQAIKATIDAVKWVITNIKPIAIVTAVVLVLGNATIFVISVVQSVNPTPHYYCDTEATRSIKKTAVYQQYCTDAGSFELDNLNGHYIIQDGPGPCTDCSMNNLFMRYYSLLDINYFDYLWGEDGQYKPEGQILTSSAFSTPGTIRKVINGGQDSSTDSSRYRCNSSLTNGSYAFSRAHGNPLTMANWGYFRDSSLDIAEYEQTSDYYINNSASDKWVWDLSLREGARGTTWSVLWEYTLTLDGIPCVVTTINGSAITGDVIKDILNSTNGEVGDAGVVLYYDYKGDSDADHGILITGYDEDTGYWRVVDPAKGINGGFEGPLDGSHHFCSHDVELNNLLNSHNNTWRYNSYTKQWRLCRISYVAFPF